MGIRIYSENEFKKFFEDNIYKPKNSYKSDIENYIENKFQEGIVTNEIQLNEFYIEVENFWSFADNKLAFEYFNQFVEENSWLDAHIYDLAENFYESIILSKTRELTNNQNNIVSSNLDDMEYKIKTIISLSESLNQDFINISKLNEFDLIKEDENILNYKNRIKSLNYNKNFLDVFEKIKLKINRYNNKLAEEENLKGKVYNLKVGSNPKINTTNQILLNTFIIKKINNLNDDLKLTFEVFKKI